MREELLLDAVWAQQVSLIRQSLKFSRGLQLIACVSSERS